MPPPGRAIVVDQSGGEHDIPAESLQAAIDKGWSVQTQEGRIATLAGEAHEESMGGVRGAIGAFGAEALSAATLGGSDALIGAIGGEDARRQRNLLKQVNPGATTLGGVTGGLAASFAAPGSMLARSPAGMLSNLANEGVAAVRATQTGARAFAGQAAITGAEAAAQNVGQYLGSVALGDRALTAEGLGGALGSGFVLGAAGGAAVYGLEKGSIAARNLFSQVMEGGDDAARAAGSRWETKSSEVFDGNRANLDEAKRQIAEASAAVEQAQIGRLRAGQALDEERLYAARAAGEGVPGPATLPDVPAGLADDVLPPAGAVPGLAPAGEMPSGFRVPDDAARVVDELDGAPVLARNPDAPRASEIPSYDALAKSGDDYLESTVSALKLKEQGWYEPAGGHLDPVRVANARKAMETGQRDAIKLNVSETGKITVTDGRHRLAAAAELGVPIKVKWSQGFEPATSDVLRGGTKAADAAAALPAPAQRLASLVSEAEDAESALMRMLMGTKAQIDEGATLGQVGAGARAQPASPKQLGDTYDNLVEQAAQATDIGAKQALLRQASEIEDQLATLPKSAKALSDIDGVAAAMGRYEKAMADVAEELGEKASPITREMADGLRKAESGADKAMVDRATQAIDDAAEEGAKQGGGLFDAPKRAPDAPIGEGFGPTRLSSKERIAYAKERKIEADVALKGAKVTEAEARAGYKAAQRRADEIGRATDAVSLPTPKSGPDGPGAGRAADIGSALELANMVGIPGLPKPSDLPIVGPVLGLYLKARALKAGADRLMGRVPATGNAKVAALAAKTKDKAARAVDRMLGHVERSASAQRTVAAVAGPKLLEAMRERIYDDGEKAPDKDAGIQEHAAARSREISTLVANPALITAMVRKQMRDVADPEMVTAAVKFRTAQLGYLNKVSPKPPPPSPFDKSTWRPPRTEATDFARRYAVAMDPVQALEQVEQRCLTPEAAEAFKAVYPLLFEQTRNRLLDKAPALQQKLPRSQLTRMSILFDIPLDSALEPATLAMTQAAFATTRPADPTQQQTPPAPSIAGSTNLTALYQTGSDRRAAMR
jgi:hypothetical protein